ncbi:MAG TPA: SDR family oxidoreductase [Stellaceae bacterium]|nr:SDR family oxidoreductase [Stellaceae bacterium]
MQVLVIGATGLIGSAVVARLLDTGHEVRALARQTARARRSQPEAVWVSLDIAGATRPEDWRSCLADVDAVVNCAGVLQDSPADSTRGVHTDGIAALFAACEHAGVRRVVHLSAIGIDRETPTEFSRTKREGDEALMRRDLEWVILRPSVVLGPAAYGGSALFRGLAALPVLPVMLDTGPLQIVQLDVVVATVMFFLAPAAPSRIALDLAGPERLAFAEIVCRYRAWLGWREPRVVTLPRWIGAALYRVGDFAGRLGWRPPLRSTARREITRGAIGDPRRWTELTGIAPQSLSAALIRRPASVQERWFAGLYALKPVVFVTFSLFWIVTGLLSLGPGFEIGADLMRQGGAGVLSAPAVIAGGIVDIAIGCAIAWRRTTYLGLWAAIAISLFYIVAGTLMTPWLWAEPLGPFLKIFPILVLNLVALAILEDR